MNRVIESAIREFSPAHANRVIASVSPAGISDTAAQVRATLTGLNVNAGDFRNPFGRSGDKAQEWQDGWDGVDEPTHQPVSEANPDEAPDFEAMTKKQIDDWAAGKGITLDRRHSKDKMIAALQSQL